jgi:hypothetical protein
MTARDLEPLTLRPVDVVKLLGRGLYDQALAAGWLKPCSRRKGARRDVVRYSTAAVRAVEHRILAGEYPPPPKRCAKK